MTLACRVDFHTHTSHFSGCGRQLASELAAAATAAGLDTIFLTDHDYQWSESELVGLCRRFPALTILAGVEISCRGGEHLLAFGLPQYDQDPGVLDLSNALQLVHKAGGVGIIAHPFRYELDCTSAHHGYLAGFPLDGVETCSTNVTGPPGTVLARALAAELQVPALAASDAHAVDRLGSHYSVFPEQVSSVTDFIVAVRAGQGIAVTPEEV